MKLPSCIMGNVGCSVFQLKIKDFLIFGIWDQQVGKCLCNFCLWSFVFLFLPLSFIAVCHVSSFLLLLSFILRTPSLICCCFSLVCTSCFILYPPFFFCLIFLPYLPAFLVVLPLSFVTFHPRPLSFVLHLSFMSFVFHLSSFAHLPLTLVIRPSLVSYVSSFLLPSFVFCCLSFIFCSFHLSSSVFYLIPLAATVRPLSFNRLSFIHHHSSRPLLHASISALLSGSGGEGSSSTTSTTSTVWPGTSGCLTLLLTWA